MDDELQAFFERCEREDQETMEWLRQVAEEEIDWNALLSSVPTAGDIF